MTGCISNFKFWSDYSGDFSRLCSSLIMIVLNVIRQGYERCVVTLAITFEFMINLNIKYMITDIVNIII